MPKLTRRQTIKALAGAGIVLTSASVLGGIPISAQPSRNENLASQGSEPLVLIVKGNQITGYKGINERLINDSSLAATLAARFA